MEPKNSLTPPLTRSCPADISGSPLSLPFASSFPSPLFFLLINNLLTASECQHLLSFALQSTPYNAWPKAGVMTGNDSTKQQVVAEGVRKCGRIILDNQEIADALFARIHPYLNEVEILGGKEGWDRYAAPDARPESGGAEDGWMGVIGSRGKGGQRWRLSRLNNQLKFLRYQPGDFFKPHHDLHFVSPANSNLGSKEEVSFLTVHLYLNDCTEGGATTIFSPDGQQRVDVPAKSGSALIFQQRDVLHAGEEVRDGVKYSVRGDVMFVPVEENES